MKNFIYDKTDKGREEIATRKHQLAPRLRTLLLLVDGKSSVAALLPKIAGLGLDEQSITELLEQGFIRQVATQAATAEMFGAADAQPASSAPDASATLPDLSDKENQFLAIYRFYNETIKSALGLRGYGLQLKVERASSIEEFRELRQPYLEALMKAKGKEIAKTYRDRLDPLLYMGETIPNTTIGPNTITAG
ncbi:hypothetical protein [Noviherbaspirillum massiliense]|uniref:hypothetical protein n=1 Tax=Noviherbaspirillum massiliense TaxID=1465823 RepID=UPI000305A12D|nr:hypothetical protein [Noviherbaspirillum massiliense]